jgi:probable addiction module antidote protein
MYDTTRLVQIARRAWRTAIGRKHYRHWDALDNPNERAGGLIMLRAVAEANGGVGAVAAQAGISRESLYRSLSPKGNPTLKTLIAVLKTLGLRLSVTPVEQVRARQTRNQNKSVAA